jgi:hypothetical protein
VNAAADAATDSSEDRILLHAEEKGNDDRDPSPTAARLSPPFDDPTAESRPTRE